MEFKVSTIPTVILVLCVLVAAFDFLLEIWGVISKDLAVKIFATAYIFGCIGLALRWWTYRNDRVLFTYGKPRTNRP